MERARIMKIIRRFLANSSAVFSSPPPDGAKIPRRSTSPPLRPTSGPNNRPDSLPPSKNSAGLSALDLDAKPSAEVDADASSTATGLMARRRRQRQKRRQRPRDANPAQERSEDLEAAKPTVSYPKNAASDQELSAKLDTAKHAAPSADLDIDLDAKNRLAAKKRRQRQNQRERERKANNVAMGGEELSAKLDTAKAKAKPTATDLNPLHLEHGHQNSGIVLRPLDAPPIGDRDGLHGAALAVPATSTIGKREVNNELLPTGIVLNDDGAALNVADSSNTEKKKPALPAHPRPDLASAPAAPQRPSRLPTSVPVPEHGAPAAANLGRQCLPAASIGPGLLDDIQGVEKFFFHRRGGLFDQPDENEDRARHHRYLEACSSLQNSHPNLTYCLACFLRDEKDGLTKVKDDPEKMDRHMRSSHSHKAFWIKCEKRGCNAMASKVDIDHHQRYVHQM